MSELAIIMSVIVLTIGLSAIIVPLSLLAMLKVNPANGKAV